MVLRAKDESVAALSTLCETYRQPLLVWLRAQGHSPSDAEDMVQGCLHDLLRRDFLKNVARGKGKFRTFLLTCLKNYIRDQHDKRMTGKRGQGQRVESLDETYDDGQHIHVPLSAGPGPDLEYDRAWAQAVLASALRGLAVECARQGKAALFEAIEPVMFGGEEASPYREIGIRLGMSEGAVKMAAQRIRARLQGLVREEVKQTVGSKEDWQEEIRYLIELFGPPA